MAALPNKQFWVNWNARNYDAATHTIAKEAGQLFNEDLVLHTAAQAYTDEYVTIDTSNSRILFNFQDTASNPFNRTSSTATITIVAKTRSTNSVWFISNRRDGTVGWMVKQGTDKYAMAYRDEWYYYTSNTAPMTMAWRNGNGTMQYISYSDNVTGTPYSATDWVGQQTTQFVVFGSGGGENWTGDFYWVYISPEVLTDAEIQQVINYNENATVFEPSQDTFSFGFNGGTQTFTVEADNAWTCAAPTDFTISPMSGNSGTTTVTITAPRRISTVSDTITFTDTQSNTFDISISQSVGTITPNLTIYQGADTVKKMYYGNGLVYRKMAHSPSLVISGDSFSFPPTSYTAATVVVTTDANWSYSTEASWLSLTKTGNNLEIVPASDWDQGSAPRTATVTVTADNGFITKSAEISVKQSNTNVTNVDWVWVANQGASTGTYIDTGIIPTTDTSFRVVFQPISYIGSALVGYSFTGDTQARTPMYAADDDSDYRVFFYNSTSTMYFDFNSSRISKSVTNSGGFVDLTCTNNSITDNLTGQSTTGTTQSSMTTTTVPLYINLSNYAKVRSVEVWQGNTKVYDGHAAWDGENYGWSDSISGTFSTTTYGGYALTGAPVPDLTDYLSFTAEQANSTVGMVNYRTDASIDTPVLYYSRDKVMWAQWDYSPITLTNVGDKVYLYGTNNRIGNDDSNYSSFQMSGRIAASGDVTTLLTRYGTTQLTHNYCFIHLFDGCTSLTTAPAIPATTLQLSCYKSMFNGCTALTSAPALPATTLAIYCYQRMFQGCTSLTTAPAELPATTLAGVCYDSMFKGCTSLTAAPALPATTLEIMCYYSMFQGCTSLASITCLAEDISAFSCTKNWLDGVSASGTFTKSANMNDWTTGVNGIPSGWTVVDA